jgi:hypothetical protein
MRPGVPSSYTKLPQRRSWIVKNGNDTGEQLRDATERQNPLGMYLGNRLKKIARCRRKDL